jgi:hypothetical protein
MNGQTAKTVFMAGLGCGVRKGSIRALPIYQDSPAARKVVISRQQLGDI